MAYEPIARIIKPARKYYGRNRAGMYDVTVERTGEFLGCFKSPEQGAARILCERGSTGPMTTRWEGSTCIAMTSDIKKTAECKHAADVVG